MDIFLYIVTGLVHVLPYIGLAISLIFQQELRSLWKGYRAKHVNNTYTGSFHWMQSHNFGTGIYIKVLDEKSFGKGAGCNVLDINKKHTFCVPWSVYAQYAFREITSREKEACEKAIEHNEVMPREKWITVETLLDCKEEKC